MGTRRSFFPWLMAVGCSGPSGASTAGPTAAAGSDDTPRLLAALRLPAPERQGTVDADAGGGLRLAWVGSDATLPVPRLPSRCLDDAPGGPWLVFAGAPAVSVELVIPPRIVAWDGGQGCLVGAELDHPARGLGSLPPTGEITVEFDVRAAEHRRGDRQARGSIPVASGPVSLALAYERTQLRLQIGGPGDARLGRVEPAGCDAGRATVRVWSGGPRWRAEATAECDLGARGEAFAGRRTWRVAWVLHDSAWSEVLSEHEEELATDRGAGVIDRRWLREQSAGWMLTGGALRVRRSTGATGTEETVCDAWDGPDTCCRYPSSRRDRVREEWTWGGARVRDIGDSSDRRATRLGSGCETWLDERVDRGELQRRDGWLLGPRSPGPIPRASLEGWCGPALPGVPLHLPSRAEARTLLESGTVEADRLWIEIPDPKGPRFEVDPASEADGFAICVQRAGQLW